eukprot:XP_011678048.1 PREDICTED: uncharacterized protein LOC105444907 [Strongylocentrotus purpuratus]
MQVQTVKLDGCLLCPTPASLPLLVEALCSMPNLTDLILGIHLNEEFYSTLKAKASSIQGCFPQIRKGNFRLNDVIQDDLNSFLHNLSSRYFRYDSTYHATMSSSAPPPNPVVHFLFLIWQTDVVISGTILPTMPLCQVLLHLLTLQSRDKINLPCLQGTFHQHSIRHWFLRAQVLHVPSCLGQVRITTVNPTMPLYPALLCCLTIQSLDIINLPCRKGTFQMHLFNQRL